MAELSEPQQYAAAGLMTIALAEVKRLQFGLPVLHDRRQAAPEELNEDFEFTGAWLGLAQQVYSNFGLAPKVWVSLEKMAKLDDDIKIHLGGLLTVLSENDSPDAGESGRLSQFPSQIDRSRMGGPLSSEVRRSSLEIRSPARSAGSGSQSKVREKEAKSKPQKPDPSGSSTTALGRALSKGKSKLAELMGRRLSLDGPAPSAAPAQAQETQVQAGGTLVQAREPREGSASRLSLDGPAPSAAPAQAQETQVQTGGTLVQAREPLEGSASVVETGNSRQSEGGTTGNLESRDAAADCMEEEDEEEMGRPSMSGRETSVWTGVALSRQRKVAALLALLEATVADGPQAIAQKHGLRPGYDARERAALRFLAAWLGLEWKKVAAMEVMLSTAAHEAMVAREAAREEEEGGEGAEFASVKKRTWAKWKRRTYIGGAAILAGTALAVTGGLAAPAIGAGIGALASTMGAAGAIIPGVTAVTGTVAGAAAVVGSAAGSVAVAGSFGAAGAGLAGYKMARRVADVEEFHFEMIGEDHQEGRLAITVMISGLIETIEDYTAPWDDHRDSDAERFGLVWESKEVAAVTTALSDLLRKTFVNNLIKQGAMMTVLQSLLMAVAWPAYLLSSLNYIDGAWGIALSRSDKAGLLLAQALLDNTQGGRPVALMGFSLGARVIFTCLQELAKAGEEGNIVERVVLLGAPVKVEKEAWQAVRKVVAGRIVNGYSTNDWTIGIVYRASLVAQKLAGVSPVEIPGIENIDLSDIVTGHNSYLTELQDILAAIDIDSCYPACPISVNVL